MAARPSSKEKVESSIPNWVVYALLGTVSLLIVKSIHGAAVTFAASGIVMLFVWTYMSKPVADIQPSREDDSSNQLNAFHKRHKIGKKYSSTNASPQRRRYLKEEEEERVA